jgi:hypothetical protein
MLKYLKLALLCAKYAPPQDVEWTTGDRKNLTAFLGTKTGAKLEAIGIAHVGQAAITACSSTNDADRHVANGIRLTWAAIDQLKFRTPQTQEGTQGDQSGIPEEFQ